NPRYNVTCHPMKPKIFKESGNYFVNLSNGLKYLGDEKPNKFSKQSLDGVKMIWDHAKNVLCSGNTKMFDYFKHWVANAATKRKMETCLYVKSGQGTGKNTFFDFIRTKVMGNAASLYHS